MFVAAEFYFRSGQREESAAHDLGSRESPAAIETGTVQAARTGSASTIGRLWSWRLRVRSRHHSDVRSLAHEVR